MLLLKTSLFTMQSVDFPIYDSVRYSLIHWLAFQTICTRGWSFLVIARLSASRICSLVLCIETRDET